MRELLFSLTEKDFEFDNFSGTGAGGQYRNRHMNSFRCLHRPSGSVGIGQRQRSYIQNKKTAFKNCVSTQRFKNWLNKEIHELSTEESIQEKLLDACDLIIEKLENNEWTIMEHDKDFY